MKMLLKRYWLPVTGILLGALGGYLYWRFVGCATGTCVLLPLLLLPVRFGEQR